METKPTNVLEQSAADRPMVSASGLDIIRSRRPSKVDSLVSGIQEKISKPITEVDDISVIKHPINRRLSHAICNEVLGIPHLSDVFDKLAGQIQDENIRHHQASATLAGNGFQITNEDDAHTVAVIDQSSPDVSVENAPGNTGSKRKL